MNRFEERCNLTRLELADDKSEFLLQMMQECNELHDSRHRLVSRVIHRDNVNLTALKQVCLKIRMQAEDLEKYITRVALIPRGRNITSLEVMDGSVIAATTEVPDPGLINIAGKVYLYRPTSCKRGDGLQVYDDMEGDVLGTLTLQAPEVK